MRVRIENLLARLLFLILGRSFFTGTAPASLLSSPSPRILVLCTGNICRSPYAEGRLRAKIDPSIEILSRGLDTTPGKPADPSAIIVAKERGVDLSAHRTASVTREELDSCPLVLIMDRTHRAKLKTFGPPVLKKATYLGAFGLSSGGPLIIADPYGHDVNTFRTCYEEIDRAVDGLATAIRGGAK